MDNSIFQRREIKFLVDSRQRAMLEQAFRGRMVPDPHGESTICNVYYDTPDYRLIRWCGPRWRSPSIRKSSACAAMAG